MKHIGIFKKFQSSLSESAIKSVSDKKFIKSIVEVLNKNGMNATSAEHNGTLRIKGEGDDEIVYFVYQYYSPRW